MTLRGEDALKWCSDLSERTRPAGNAPAGFLTETHRSMQDWLTACFDDSGLEHWRDSAANLWARLPSDRPNAPVVILGGHLSTQGGDPNDGSLGVVLPWRVMADLKRRGPRLPFHVDLLVSGAGVNGRFGVPMLGCKAVAGRWDPAWQALTDLDGTPLDDAFRAFGLDARRAAEASRQGHPIRAYLETQLERGPQLTFEDAPIGIATAISGTRRFTVEIRGDGGPAGTVPMHLRHDSLAAAAEFTLIVERIAREHGLMATVEQLHAHPDTVDAIADHVNLGLSVHAEQDSSREAALSMIWDTGRVACQERGVDMAWLETHASPAVACDDGLQLAAAGALERNGLVPRYLVSGADHSAAALSPLCPVGLLLVRRREHEDAPEVCVEDVERAAQVLRDWILGLA